MTVNTIIPQPATQSNKKLYIPFSSKRQSNLFSSDMQLHLHWVAPDITISLTFQEAQIDGQPYLPYRLRFYNKFSPRGIEDA